MVIMMEMDVPDRISNGEALELLTKEDTPVLDFEDSRALDKRGSDEWNGRRAAEAYYCKVVATRNLVRIAQEDLSIVSEQGQSVSRDEAFKGFMTLQAAAFCYDKASKDVLVLGHIMAAIRCRIRACKLHYSAFKFYYSVVEVTNGRWCAESLDQCKDALFYSRIQLRNLIEHPMNTSSVMQNGIPKWNHRYRDDWKKRYGKRKYEERIRK